MTSQPLPLSGPPPAEVPLPRAPLARVIAQVRFPPILTIRNPDKVAVFQEGIRTVYPILKEDRFHHLVVTPAAASSFREELIWRFNDSERPKWRVSLNANFVALETSAYVSRQEFLVRLEAILRCLEESFKPTEAQRIGMRYIDRLTGKALDHLTTLVRPEVLGIIQPTEELPLALGRSVVHLLTEAHLLAVEGRIQARWGSLPENATYDPDALEPVNDKSWVLDLDMFTLEPQDFATEGLLMTATHFAKRIYAVFREMVTNEFLRFYGGVL